MTTLTVTSPVGGSEEPEPEEEESLTTTDSLTAPGLGAGSMKDYFRQMEQMEARGAGLTYQKSVIELPGVNDILSPMGDDMDSSEEDPFAAAIAEDGGDVGAPPGMARSRSGARTTGSQSEKKTLARPPSSSAGAKLDTVLSSKDRSSFMGFAFASQVLAQATTGTLDEATHDRLETVMAPDKKGRGRTEEKKADEVAAGARDVSRTAGMTVHIGGRRAYEDLLDHLQVRRRRKKKRGKPKLTGAGGRSDHELMGHAATTSVVDLPSDDLPDSTTLVKTASDYTVSVRGSGSRTSLGGQQHQAFFGANPSSVMMGSSVHPTSSRFTRGKTKIRHNPRQASVSFVDSKGDIHTGHFEGGSFVETALPDSSSADEAGGLAPDASADTSPAGSVGGAAAMSAAEASKAATSIDDTKDDDDLEDSDEEDDYEEESESSSKTMQYELALWKDCEARDTSTAAASASAAAGGASPSRARSRSISSAKKGISKEGVEFFECDIVSIEMEAELLEGKRPDATRFQSLQYWFQFINSRFYNEANAKLILGTELPTYDEWRTRRNVRGFRGTTLKNIDYALKSYLACVDIMKAMVKNTHILCYDQAQKATLEFPGCDLPNISKAIFNCGPVSVISAWNLFEVSGSSPSNEGWQRVVNSDTPGQRFLETSPEFTAISSEKKRELANFHKLKMFLWMTLSEYFSNNMSKLGCNANMKWSDIVQSADELSSKLKKATGVGSCTPGASGSSVPASLAGMSSLLGGGSKKGKKGRTKRSATMDALQNGTLSIFDNYTFHLNPFVDKISSLMLLGIHFERGGSSEPKKSDGMAHATGAIKGSAMRSLNQADYVSDNKIVAEPIIWTIYIYRFLLDRQKKLYKLIAAAQAPAMSSQSDKLKTVMNELAKDAKKESDKLRELMSRLPAINDLIDAFIEDVTTNRDAAHLPADSSYVKSFVSQKTDMFETKKENIEELLSFKKKGKK